jgi:cell division protein ZipA
METSTLRWIIIIIGVLVLGSIFLFGNPDKKRKPSASRKKEKPLNERREPTLDESPGSDFSPAEEGDVQSPGSYFREPDQGELLVEAPVPTPAEPEPPRRPRKPAGPPPEKIKSLFLLARDNHIINGAELLQATIKTGMEFGDMDIFHRIDDTSERPIFSLANAAKPGHFDRDAWNTFETSAVVLFMALPGPVPGLDAWDSLFATARRIGEILQADLMDEDHNPFTRLKEAQIREEMRDYDRSKS